MKIEEKLTTIASGINIWDINKYDTNLIVLYYRLYGYPTGNCQMCCVAYFNILLTHFDFKTEIFRIKKLAKQPILLVDIQEAYVQKTEQLCGEAIFSKTKYKSTNGSEMFLILINLDYFKE